VFLRSLRCRLVVLWLISLVACAAVGVMLVELYRQSSAAQVERAEAILAHSCDPDPGPLSVLHGGLARTSTIY